MDTDTPTVGQGGLTEALVEAVARAMDAADENPCDPDWRTWEKEARAAIAVVTARLSELADKWEEHADLLEHSVSMDLAVNAYRNCVIDLREVVEL